MKKLKLINIIIFSILLLLFSQGCTIETVEQHNNELSSNIEQQSSLLKLDDDLIDSGYIKVSLKIICSSVLGNEDLDTSSKIPEDGIILDTQVVVPENSSVFQILNTVLEQNNIAFEYQGTADKPYVTSINDLAQFQCGKNSGWIYTVNDTFYNVGSSGYIAKNGDNILWEYITVYKQ